MNQHNKNGLTLRTIKDVLSFILVVMFQDLVIRMPVTHKKGDLVVLLERKEWEQ